MFIAAPKSRPPSNRAKDRTSPRSPRFAGQLLLASSQAAKMASLQNAINSYHSYFVGTDYYGYQQHYIHYAVMPYPGHGANPTAQLYGYPNELAELTDTASHEIAETATDPRQAGWYDNRLGMAGEIGDLTNSYHQYLGSYYVQLLANKNDAPMALANGIYYYDGQAYRVSGLPYDAPQAVTSAPSIGLATAVIDEFITGFHIYHGPRAVGSNLHYGGQPAAATPSMGSNTAVNDEFFANVDNDKQGLFAYGLDIAS